MKFKAGKIIKKLFLALVFFGSTAIISGCGPKEEVCGSSEEYATPITDSFKFKHESYIDKNNFVSAPEGSGIAISEVKVTAYTDGDTTNFQLINGVGDESDKFRARYQGINTPESTGKIEPWGLKASVFTKSKLKKATSIIVINDLIQFSKTDTSGGRMMAFVWYKTETTDYRLLNLEIVEQGYSINQLKQNSSNLDGYFDAFKEAGEAAEKAGRRVHGEKDCDYDSSGDVVETTIANAKENYDTLGVDYETSSGGKKLRITAIITGVSGYNFYCRDVAKLDTDETYSGIYAFTQYKSIDIKPGCVVRFYCKITKYGGNYQLTDLETSTIASKYAFEIIARTKEEVEALGYEYNNEAYTFKDTSVTKYEDLGKFGGNYINVPLTVGKDRNDPTKPYYESKTASGNKVFTVLTKYKNFKLNIRLEGHDFFNAGEVISDVFSVGKTYNVKAFVSAYQYESESELEYQLQLPNFGTSYYGDFISEVE